MKHEITCDENHVYRVDGVEYPSVTQIIKAEGLMPNYPDNGAGKFAMQRGTFVHEIVELYIEGALDVATIDPHLKPYFDAFVAWYTQFCVQTINSCEEKLFNPSLKYCGTSDLNIERAGATWLIDIKTGAPSTWHNIQLAGYALCYPVTSPVRAILYLQPDGKYKMVAVRQIKQDDALFISAVNLYHWKKNNNIL